MVLSHAVLTISIIYLVSIFCWTQLDFYRPIHRRYYIMTFSDFMKILYTYIGDGFVIPEFIIHITDQIMKESCTKETTQSNANGKGNPLSVKSNDMLYKIYHGKKALPKRDAQIILAHIDPDCFRSYLLHFPKEIINKIASELRAKNVKMNIDEDNEEDVETTCAELFASIIERCAKKHM